MAQPFRSLLGNAPELRPLLNKAHTLSALQRQFASVAPAYLGQSSMVLGLQFGTLSIAVANSTVAAKLRQLAPELVVLLQNKGCEVSGIRVKVQVAYAAPQPQQRPRELSKTARNALNELGSNLDDSPLKQALQRMARKTG
ncbi:MAG TPA: DciA family protein [Gallionella sp.]|nr:DciA family protein [Gallionella sp.]